MPPMLLKLLLRNKAAPRRALEVQASADGSDATLYLYDVIVGDEMTAEWYGGGISPEAFIQSLQGITAPIIHLRINSPGGDVFGARCMEQAVRDCHATVIAHVDGLCASAATYLAMAADEVEMAPGAFLMIHQSACGAYGNADDLMDAAALLEKIDDSIVTTYQQKSGRSASQIQDWMAAETWFSAQEAVGNGFADRIADSTPVENRWDVSAYRNAPAPVLTPPPAAVAPPTLDLTREQLEEMIKARVADALRAQAPAPPPEPAINLDHHRRRLALAEKSA
jgi:ATP-dependent Clp protease protease subunit